MSNPLEPGAIRAATNAHPAFPPPHLPHAPSLALTSVAWTLLGACSALAFVVGYCAGAYPP